MKYIKLFVTAQLFLLGIIAGVAAYSFIFTDHTTWWLISTTSISGASADLSAFLRLLIWLLVAVLSRISTEGHNQ